MDTRLCLRLDLEDFKQQFDNQGVIVLSDVLPLSLIQEIAVAATACFTDLEAQIVEEKGQILPLNCPDYYQVNLLSTSVHGEALTDHGLPRNWWQELWSVCPQLAPLSQALGNFVQGARSQIRLRKQYAPGRGHAQHRPNQWHEDGALGLTYPPQPEGDSIYCRQAVLPLLTLWLPLSSCGQIAPGLELITQPQIQLIHYSALTTGVLQQHFPQSAFWQPQLSPGSMVLFAGGTLHRTAIHRQMRRDRLSLEFRLFNPQLLPPAWATESWFTVY
jgi:hypothetical protein